MERKTLGDPNVSLHSEPSRSPELMRICDLLREGKLRESEVELQKFLKSDPQPADQLEAYAHLARIAAELRTFEKIPAYIEVVKKIPLETNAEKVKFAECLHAIGTGWLYSGKPEKARQHYQQSLEIAQEVGDSNLAFINRLLLVEIIRLEGNYEEVLRQIEVLEKAAAELPVKSHLGSVHILQGNVLRKQGRYQQAIQAFDKARDVFSENKNSGRYHYVLWAMGTCYAALEDKEKALIYLELATHSGSGSQSVEFWRINTLANLTLAELFTVIGQYDRAAALYNKVAEAAGAEESSYYGRRVLRGQTLLSIKQGEFEKANELIDRLVVVALKDSNNREIMRLRLLKAEVLLRTGETAQHDEARAMLQEALAYYRERRVRRHQAVCLELLARLDSRSGYPSDALKKVKEMLELADESHFERLWVRAKLAHMVLSRKLGRTVGEDEKAAVLAHVNRLNAEGDRVILSRFQENFDEWTADLSRLDPHFQRYVNEFFEDFHFVPTQSTDIEIDQNSHYVREKHLGEIPFHNKFTLMRILCLLAETPGREFSKEQLAGEIWGQDYNPLRHDNNIYININRLRKLIEPNPRESRYVMNGSKGYYFNPAMKVNISSKISDVAPRLQNRLRLVEGVRPENDI